MLRALPVPYAILQLFGWLGVVSLFAVRYFIYRLLSVQSTE